MFLENKWGFLGLTQQGFHILASFNVHVSLHLAYAYI